MGRVPHKQIIPDHPVTLENIFQDRLPSLGIPEIYNPRDWQKSFPGPFIKCVGRIAIAPYREGTILIFSVGAQEKLTALGAAYCRDYFAHLSFRKAALLVFCQSATLPDFLKKQIHRHHLPAAVSSLHENLLESRIKAIVQEKIKKCITIHGVVLENHGKGILITGQSGIGKTTAALQAVREGYIWIADDRAVIKKHQSGRLFISGHGKIKDYFHTAETGIVDIGLILKSSQIKNKTALAAVIDVIRTDGADGDFQFLATEIMEIRLPVIKITIPRTGFFNKNLLGMAIQKLNEVGY
jgi:serine kinase of HPr protein (carbohydrate metabolism regulator)